MQDFRERTNIPLSVRPYSLVTSSQRNFYSPRSSTVYHHSDHGTQVMSCIAGYYEDRPIGAGPDVEFLLARIEHKWWEPSREEDHWLAAAEWADKLGANLINASLTYVKEEYGFVGAKGPQPLVSKPPRSLRKKVSLSSIQSAMTVVLPIPASGSCGVASGTHCRGSCRC